MAGGWFRAEQVIGELALRGLFRASDLDGTGVARAWLTNCAEFGLVVRHGHGVWGHPRFVPDAYELIQVRHPRAVFVLECALWLFGRLPEEPHIIVGIGMTDRRPVQAGVKFEAVRLDEPSRDSVRLERPGRPVTLRVQTATRAEVELRRLRRHVGPRSSERALPWAPHSANPPPPPPPTRADGRAPQSGLPAGARSVLDELPDPPPSW